MPGNILSLMEEVILLRTAVKAIDDIATYQMDRENISQEQYRLWSQVYRYAHASFNGQCFPNHKEWRDELFKEKSVMQEDNYLIVGTAPGAEYIGILETSATEETANDIKLKYEKAGYTNLEVIDTRTSKVWI